MKALIWNQPSSPEAVRPELEELFTEDAELQLISTETANIELIASLRAAGFRVDGALRRGVTALSISRKEWDASKKTIRPDLNVGDSYEENFSLSREQIAEFARLSGDNNPVHLDDAAAKAAGFPGVIAHGVFTGAVFSRLLGTKLPGHGTIYISQIFTFKKPVFPGAKLKARLEILSKIGRRVILRTAVLGDGDEVLLDGEAEVMVQERGHG